MLQKTAKKFVFLNLKRFILSFGINLNIIIIFSITVFSLLLWLAHSYIGKLLPTASSFRKDFHFVFKSNEPEPGMLFKYLHGSSYCTLLQYTHALEKCTFSNNAVKTLGPAHPFLRYKKFSVAPLVKYTKRPSFVYLKFKDSF